MKIVNQTHYITFQDINLQPYLYFKIACVKSVLWLALISNVVNVSLSGGSLCYWTACTNFKRYCTLPYCDNVHHIKIKHRIIKTYISSSKSNGYHIRLLLACNMFTCRLVSAVCILNHDPNLFTKIFITLCSYICTYVTCSRFCLLNSIRDRFSLAYSGEMNENRTEKIRLWYYYGNIKRKTTKHRNNSFGSWKKF